MTAEQKARELLHRMGIEGALDMTAGDLGELANLIADRDEDMAEHPPAGLAGGPPIDLLVDTMKMAIFGSGASTRAYDEARLRRTHEPDGMPTRPDCWGRAMDFLGDPEAPQIEAYVERLEAYARSLDARLGITRPADLPPAAR